MDVGAWLAALGLERYAQAFADNDINAETLVALTSEDLKELGITSLGHRKKLLAAIASLSVESGQKDGAAVVREDSVQELPAPAAPGRCSARWRPRRPG